MRLPVMLLVLLVLAVAAVVVPRALTSVAASSSAPVRTDDRREYAWGYAADAPFHDVLPAAVQTFTSAEPRTTATEVCAALGGEVLHIGAVSATDERVAFVCAFREPDITISADFGDLRRIPVN